MPAPKRRSFLQKQRRKRREDRRRDLDRLDLNIRKRTPADFSIGIKERRTSLQTRRTPTDFPIEVKKRKKP